jgi:hypothetical protein
MTVLVTVIVVIVVVIAVAVLGTVIGRRRGYNIGGDTIVRCSAGHLFTTIWLPGISLKAVRLGTSRYQHCPVGHHWARVRPVRVDELTDEERRSAEEHHDLPIP